MSCSRRDFLLATGAVVLLGEVFPGRVFAQDADKPVRLTGYPKRKIGKLSELAAGEPVEFLYPDDGPHSICMLYKLGRRAGGGVGPDNDVVAFNQLCTHQGGLLRGQYSKEHAVAGPCPIHLTTFDLERHGMVVSGHATENLPQVVLELDGDDIYATAVLGLIYGYPANTAFVKGS